ncbi:MAG: glycosyltransferase family 2 protein [Opitutaceae bacterium]|nr:glycosyltransferase family 2 protein [Cytophagales bacterium]
MPAFDIIIPSYNNQEELLSCLRGFAKQTFKDFQVFICIDGSTDNSVESVRKANLSFEYTILEHQNKLNQGRNATRNLALEYIKSQYLLFFDSDITPYPNLIEKHLDVLQQKTCISVGNVNYLNKHTDLWAGYISKRGYNKFQSLEPMPPEYMNMGNLAMPSYYFTSIKGMDGSLKKYGGDDSELSIRLEKAFKPLVINNNFAKGYCVSKKTFDYALAQIEEFGSCNLKIIHQKHPGFGNIYAYDLMRGVSIKSLLFKALMKKRISIAIKKSIPYLPPILRFKAVHYLTAFYLYKGFSKQA